MTVKIQNDLLAAEIDLYGGKLVSLVSNDGTEYIWRGTSMYWPDRACLLFPTSGRLYLGQYTHKGRTYGMPLHGFAYTSDFTVSARSSSSVTLTFSDNPRTYAAYPFRFRFSVTYGLEGNTLKVKFSVNNTGTETMYFALGFHPWFNIPVNKKHSFGDYSAIFPDSDGIKVCKMSESVLDSGERLPLGSDKIRLDPSLFAGDALMLEGPGGEVRITCGQGEGVTVDYGGMPYVGLWNTASPDAQFLCVEPMSALPGREGRIEEWSGRRDMTSLEAGKTYETVVKVTAEGAPL